MFDSWGFAPDPTGEFTTLSKTYIAEFGWDRNEVRAHLRQIPWSATGKRWIFAWTIHQIARFQVWIFKNILEMGTPSPLPRPLPRSTSGFAFDSGFDLKSRALRALRLDFTLNSPPICLFLSINRGELDKIFSPSTSTSWLRHCVL